MIAQSQQENRQLNKVILERKKTQPSKDVPMVKATPVVVKSKGKEKVIKEYVKKDEIPTTRITR